MSTSWSDPSSMPYHLKQYENTKESTIEFSNFISEEVSSSNFVIDLGCGAGAATTYLSKTFPDTKFLGVDIDETLIAIANKFNEEIKNHQLRFQVADLFSLPTFQNDEVQGVVSLQTLSWVESHEKAMEQIYSKLNPSWISISSLFYPGEISADIRIKEHISGRELQYNVISIPQFEQHARKFGYSLVKYQFFEIGIDIEKTNNLDSMGTYTVQTKEKNNSRLQISGPILMPWYFVKLHKM